MRWIRPLSPDLNEPADVIGGKAHGLVTMMRLGLPVPPGFVVTVEACRAFWRDGHPPAGLDCELDEALTGLEAATGRPFAAGPDPLTVSVRSGAPVSMPGMMTTVLDVGASDRAGSSADPGASDGVASPLRPESPRDRVRDAVQAVFASWESPRARTYRQLHGIEADLGTAVVVQAMVHGDADARSGAGVAFSRDPVTGEPAPYGEILFGAGGRDVVDGRRPTRPLGDLAARDPAVWSDLLAALDRIEAHVRDAAYVEFTVDSGRLWLLQMRPGRFTGAAAVRVAVDLADAGAVDRDEAVARVTARDLDLARAPRLDLRGADVLARGTGACPGVAAGRLVTTADDAARLAACGLVVLARPWTSPQDMHGIAAATGLLTSTGGPTCHAAVVARSLGRPAVVGARGLRVDDDGVRVGGRLVPVGSLLALDGGGGWVVAGEARTVEGGADPYLARLAAWTARSAGAAGGRTTA